MGPGTFLSSAVAGATYGYSLIWALALALLFRYVWVNTAASYVLVTRESLLQGYARIGRWLVWTALVVTILVRHSSNLYTVLLMGNAAHLLLPLPTPASGAIWSVALTLLGVVMMISGGYPLIERVLQGGDRDPRRVVACSGGVLASRSGRHPPRNCSFRRSRNSQGLYSALLLLAAMIGAQAGTMSNLSYAYFATEKGWQGAKDLAAPACGSAGEHGLPVWNGHAVADRRRGDAVAARPSSPRAPSIWCASSARAWECWGR